MMYVIVLFKNNILLGGCFLLAFCIASFRFLLMWGVITSLKLLSENGLVDPSSADGLMTWGLISPDTTTDFAPIARLRRCISMTLCFSVANKKSLDAGVISCFKRWCFSSSPYSLFRKPPQGCLSASILNLTTLRALLPRKQCSVHRFTELVALCNNFSSEQKRTTV